MTAPTKLPAKRRLLNCRWNVAVTQKATPPIAAPADAERERLDPLVTSMRSIAKHEREHKGEHELASLIEALCDRVDAPRTPAPEPQPAGEVWQPIETAPKDGTCVIVGVAGLPRSVGESYWWQSEQGPGGWQTWDGENHTRTVYDPGPTHWRPMPKEPQ